MSEQHHYFTVEVCDDHDGGSVWYVHEDYIPERDEADELATRVSKERENQLARVSEVYATVVSTFEDGKVQP